MKKTYIYSLTIVAVFWFLKPSLEDFYDYLPTKTRGNEKQLRELTNIGKEYDFIIFAVYKISIQDKRRKRNARFIGIAKNFILVQYENLPDSFWQP